MDKTVIALGFFDGVHKGHQKILQTAVSYAGEHRLQSAACTFDRHPRAFVHGIAPAMLTTLSERVRLIAGQGIERVEVIAFSEETAKMEPREFVRLLKEKYNCVAAVCGEDFRFGAFAGGNAQTLRENGIDTVVCPPVELGGEGVSSTRIRRLLAEGRSEDAAVLLGRSYCLFGRVVDGFKIGRRMGIPTMNLRPEQGLLIPQKGVYASKVSVNGETFKAITNIGTRPTFSRDDIISVESYILDFSGDIYGKEASVEITGRIRDERRFGSEKELVGQIKKDIAAAKEILSREDKV